MLFWIQHDIAKFESLPPIDTMLFRKTVPKVALLVAGVSTGAFLGALGALIMGRSSSRSGIGAMKYIELHW